MANPARRSRTRFGFTTSAGDIDAAFQISRCCRGVAVSFHPSPSPNRPPLLPVPRRPDRRRCNRNRRPQAFPASRSRGPRSPRAAACHNGMSFDRFLADLKQQAVAEGVSQRALAEAAPYLVYDQSIVNRDRGQRVFGQVFTEFARNRASEGAAKNAQAQSPDACGSVRARGKGIWRAAGGDRRVLGAGEQFWRRAGQAAYAAVAGVAGL